VVEKLLTDENLRIRFALDAMETVAELLLQGFDLTRDEMIFFAGPILGRGSRVRWERRTRVASTPSPCNRLVADA
jgi:hypothetical protein